MAGIQHLEFLVEELSMEAALSEIVPKIIGPAHTFRMHAYQGKRDLLRKLKSRLDGYRRWLPSDYGLVVVLDQDGDDCGTLKNQLESAARQAGFVTRSTRRSTGSFQVLNRIAIEELEAWFFGDVQAVSSAYRRVPLALSARRGYRDPDKIAGGTWEALEKVLQRAGHHLGGLSKIAAARAIAKQMDPDRNTSRSFQAFSNGLRDLVG